MGFSGQINLGQHKERYVRMAKAAGATSNKDFLLMLLDSYETPHTDNSEVIANLNLEIEDLKSQNAAYDTTCKSYEAEIAQLKLDLAAARNEANDNAAKAQKMLTETEGCIILHPNPVSAYFLNEMAEKTGRTPGKILEKLFIDDLQNPRSNNLPYDVSGRRVREVMEQLKKEAEQ